MHDNVHQSLSEVFSVFLWLLKLSDICLCTILFFNWFELVRLPSFWFSCCELSNQVYSIFIITKDFSGQLKIGLVLLPYRFTSLRW